MTENTEKYFEEQKKGRASDILNDGTKEIKIYDSVNAGISDLFTFFLTFLATYFTFSRFNENNEDFTVSIVYLLFSIFTCAILIYREKKFPKEAVFPSVLLFIVILSFSFVSTDDILRMLLTCYLYGYTVCALKGIKVFPVNNAEDAYFQISALFFIPIKNVFLPIIVFFRKITALQKNKSKKLTKITGIFLGIILAVPVFLMVSRLLENADFAFHYYFSVLTENFSSLFDKITDIVPLNLDNLLPSLFLTPFIFSFIFCAKHGITKKAVDKSLEKQMIKKLSVVGSGFISGFYSLISIAYIVFIFSQFTYFFAVFSGSLPFGYSLSSYARQGFFEMSAVAAINFCLVILGEIFSRKNSKNETPKIWKYFSLFFSIFTLLLIITAAAKMMLYIRAYGLTEKRIAVVVADIVLFITFIITGIRLFRKNIPHFRIVFSSFVIAAVFLIVVPLGAIASSFNTEMYLSGYHKTIDLNSIRISDCIYAAAENLNKLTESNNTAVADKAKKQLYTQWYYNKDYSERAYNLDTFLFRKFSEENKKKLDSIKTDEHIGYGNAPDTYIKTEQNYTCADIYLTLDMPESVTKIKIENSLFKKVIQNNDGSPLFVGETISVHDWCTVDGNGEFAVITIYLENGEAHSFELRKDRFFVSENPERCFNVGNTDYFNGEIQSKPDGHIFLTNAEFS